MAVGRVVVTIAPSPLSENEDVGEVALAHGFTHNDQLFDSYEDDALTVARPVSVQ